MSLTIKFIIENDSETQVPNNGLFGFEIWRKSLWGNPVISNLGCVLIPTLRHADIFATEKNLENLKEDLLLIQNNIEKISNHTEVDKESIQLRVSNALEFIEIAEKENDIIGVYIG